jgi:3-oxoacyl-[acyl-carrier-protein] synthase III
MTAYITATGAFLPGYPVPNDEIEDYIGKAGRASSDLKDLVLTNCGIKTRHYAIDKKQQTVISNAAMAANAVRNAVERAGLGPNEVELLSAATTLPDLINPGHASMVHGELGYGPLEIATAHGVCSSGMMALKNAYLQVAIGEKRTAVCVASEFASRGLKSTRYDQTEAISEDGSDARHSPAARGSTRWWMVSCVGGSHSAGEPSTRRRPRGGLADEPDGRPR